MATATPDDPHKVSHDLTPAEQERLIALRQRYVVANPADRPEQDSDTGVLTPTELEALETRFGPRQSASEAERNASAGRYGEGDSDNTELQSLQRAERYNGGNTRPQEEGSLFRNEDSSEKQDTPKKKRSWASRRNIGIGAGIIVGGGGAAIIGGFSFLLPLKVTSLIQRVDSLFQSAPQAAMQKMADNLFNKYVAQHVLPGINTGLCKSTIEPTCVADIGGNDPISHLYQAWRQNRMETKLAKDHGIVFGKRGGKLYMAVNGQDALTDADLQQVLKGEASIFDVGKSTTVTEARKTARQALKDTTKWWEFHKRYSFLKFLEAKYGIRFCVMACDIQDKFLTNIADKKLAAKAAFVQRVISPISEEYSIMFQCLLSPDTAFCSQTLEKIKNLSPGEKLDDANLTPFEKNLQAKLATYAEDPANDLVDLASAVKNANSIAEKGFAETIIEKVLTTVFGEQIGRLGVKAVPVVGWVLLAAQVISLADKLGPTVRWMGYAINAAAAAKLYATYSTVSAETMSGHIDAAELGSFVDSLSTNMSGSPNNQVDATTTPLYGALFGDAASTTKYTCNDGNPVPQGQVICPEEKLDRGNDIADRITSIVNFVPGLTSLAHIINWANDIIGAVTGTVLETACNTILNVPPGAPASCPNTVKQAGQYVGQFTNWFTNILLPSPFTTDMSGGRTFDMVIAGADVTANKSCQVQLGCAKLSDQQIADIRSKAVAAEKEAFDQQPVFARMFSTSSPYSLVSRLAVAMPSSLPQASSCLVSMIANPLRTLGSVFGNIFGGSRIFAAPAPMADPFGVVQYGYLPSQIPDDPQAYYTAHCTDQTDIDWMASLPQDQGTGEPLATTPNPCLLIKDTLSATGSLFDSSLAPQGASNPDPQ